MSRSLTAIQATLLGLAVLLAGGLATLGLVAVGNRNLLWSNTFEVRAGFPSIRGVEVGTRVRIQGIDAGEVIALEPPTKAGGDVLLRLRLKGEYRHLVRRDATVAIVSEGMLGGKVIEIDPGTNSEPPADQDALLTSKPSKELSDVLTQVGTTLDSIANGEGTVGKLAHDPTLYHDSVRTLQQMQATLESFQRGADALKNVPLVGKSIKNPRDILDRRGEERNRKVFATSDLFTPDRATLTAQGVERLHELKSWLEGLTRHEGAELVIVAYADPNKGTEPALARKLCDDQAERVGEELAKLAPVWFGLKSRKVIALGMGNAPPPLPERTPLPPARLEIIVFVPQK